MATTIYRNGPPSRQKPFAWSYSKLKNFRACPKKHYEVDVAKNIVEPESEALKYGNQLHFGMAQRLTHGTPLPPLWTDQEDWCARVEAASKALNGQTLAEREYAITREFQTCEWFSKTAWFRAKIDVLVLAPPVAIAIDWKTGKVVEESEQLALTAQCIFVHHPEINHVTTIFAWLKESAETREDFTREDMPAFWTRIWPDVRDLEDAHNSVSYPPKPSGLCKRFCPVQSCPHHGKGSY